MSRRFIPAAAPALAGNEKASLMDCICGAARLVAEIHPDDVSPRGARRLGLVRTSVAAETGNVVHHTDL